LNGTFLARIGQKFLELRILHRTTGRQKSLVSDLPNDQLCAQLDAKPYSLSYKAYPVPTVAW